MTNEAVYEIGKQGFVPLPVPAFEIPLAVVELQTLRPGQSIAFEIEVGWGRPPAADLGELELVLREQSAEGAELLRSYEMCHMSALTRLKHVCVCDKPSPTAGTYILLGKSMDGKAFVEGPIRLKAKVL